MDDQIQQSQIGAGQHQVQLIADHMQPEQPTQQPAQQEAGPTVEQGNDPASLMAGRPSRAVQDYGQDFDAVQQYYQNQQIESGKPKQQPTASRKGPRNQHTLLQMQRAKNIQENSPYAQQFQSIPSQSKQSSAVGFNRDGGSDHKSAKQDRRRSSSKGSHIGEEGLQPDGAVLKISYVNPNRVSMEHHQSASVSANSDSQQIQQQQAQSVQNWPFYQNGQDARRSGTAPEGATRAQMSNSNNINVSSNPYGMISGQAVAALATGGASAGSASQPQHVDILKMSTSSNEKARAGQNQAANQSTGAISGGGGTHATPQTSQQNQMIAKIYGRSNKFVINHHSGGSGSFADQYKKPKVHHMKEIMRQKSTQQKQEVKPVRATGPSSQGTAQPASELQSTGAMTQATQGNILKKIKVDNARLKSFQAAQAGAQGQRAPQKFVDKKPNNRLPVTGSQKLNKAAILHGDMHRNSQSQSRTAQHSRSNVQEAHDTKTPLNQTTPQSDIRAHLEDIKTSMNQTGSQESQSKKAGAEEPAVTRSADSHRYQGRQSQASRQSRTSQQMRQREGKQSATPQVGATGASRGSRGSRQEQWRVPLNQSQAEGSAEDLNVQNAAPQQHQQTRPTGASEGGRKQKFLPKKVNQAVRGVHQARGNVVQKKSRADPDASHANANQNLALSQRQDEEANERQRLAVLDMGDGEKRAAEAKNETEETPKDGGPLQPSDFSKALDMNDSRKDKSSRICMSQFNRGLEDGSFHLVDDSQFDHHKNGHGFTMPAGEGPPSAPAGTASGAQSGPGGHRIAYGPMDPLADEGSHVLYADAHNVHFSSAMSHQGPASHQESQQDLDDAQPPGEKWKRALEGRTAKRSKQASKNFNKVNDQAVGAGTPVGKAAQLLGQEEGDKESDLETLTKLFKPEARGQADGMDEQQQAEFNLAKQQYSEMKRLQTSQGPRTVKYLGPNQKSHQSQPQPAAKKAEQIDENSDEDVKSDNYQLEADVESQNTEEGEAFVPPISNNNPRRKKGGPRSGPRDGRRNQLQRPPQTAPSSQMVQIQQQNQGMVVTSGSLHRNQKLLKIKGKLSSHGQHTQTIPNPGAQPQDEYMEQEGSRSFLGINESDPNGPSGADDHHKLTNKVIQEQQLFQNDQDNSQHRINSVSNSQQQFSRTIDPSIGNNGIGIMSGDGNGAGAPAADDKKLAGNADPGGSGEPTGKADEPSSVDMGPLQANISRNHQASKTQQPASSKRRDYIGTDHDQGKTNDMSSLVLSKPQQTQPTSNPNQAFSLTNMHSGLHPQPGQPLPLQQLGSDSGPSGPLAGVAPGPAANVLGYQYEQWQRPPSRQKEPNQALGLDDARPKTRGGNQTGSFGQTTMLGHQFYGNSTYSHSHVSGRGEGAPRERKRNIQQFIPHSNSGQGTALYQLMDGPGGAQGPGGRNQLALKQGQAGPAGASGSAANRARMIDFFHQRNNNFNGFNSQDEQVRQNSFQKQYQLQSKPEQSNLEEQRSELQGLNSGSSAPGGSGPMQKLKPRRNAGQRGFSGPIQAGSTQQRPPSRHKDPPQNLGLDLCPPGMGFASPDEFDPPIAGLTPHHHGAQKGSINGFQSFLGFDLDQDLDGQAFESDLGADDHIDTAGHFLGPAKSGLAPPKQFKEDEDDFFEQQYMKKAALGDTNKDKADNEQPKKSEKLKIRTNKRGKFARQQSDGVANAASNQQYQTGYHQRNLAGNYGGQAAYQANTSHNSLNQGASFPHQNYSQTYGHGMNMAPLLPGTAPSPGQGGKLFPYHPALQQTQNFYIGMNQILPQTASDAAQAAIVQDFFNMSANVQNMLKNPSKTSHQAKRLISTSQGPGMGHSSQTVTAFHSTGYHHRADMRQAAESTQKGVGNFNHPLFLEQYNQESLSRGFANQRSPVNERSGAIHQLLMQNANLKQTNKPKSATGHRISGKQNRFKNLNNSGRFVGQNSTIIHSAYNNQPPGAAGPHGSNPLMPQQIKMFQHPKSGGWMESSTAGPSQVSGSKPGQLIGHSQDGAQSGPNAELPGAQTFAKSQLPVGMIKPTQSTPGGTTKGNERRARAQFFPRGDSMAESNKLHNTSGFMAQGSQLQPEHSHTDSAQERIKTGQEPNNNRPKESQGHRSTGKRQTNNQSLGVTSISLAPGTNAHPMPIPPGHIKRIQMPKTGNFVSSPIAGGAGQREGPQSFIGGYQVTSLGGTQNLKKGKQNMAELFSQTSKISRGGGKRGNAGEGLQQSSMQATDKLLDLSDDPHVQGLTQMHNTTNLPFSTNNQNSFKSQTLQFPNSSQLGADFINLFAD